jgi:hypothetical protein
MKIFHLIPILFLFFSSCKNEGDSSCLKREFNLKNISDTTLIGDEFTIQNNSVKYSFSRDKKGNYKFTFSQYKRDINVASLNPDNTEKKMTYTTSINKKEWDGIARIFKEVNFWCLNSPYNDDFKRNYTLYLLSSTFKGKTKLVDVNIESLKNLKDNAYKMWQLKNYVLPKEPKIIENKRQDASYFTVISQNQCVSFKVMVDGMETKKINDSTATFKINNRVTVSYYETYQNDDSFFYETEIE